MSKRLNYRTPDGIIHLWTQEEIEKHIHSMNVVVSEVSIGPHDEALLTIQTLHSILSSRDVKLNHEVVQGLLSRIDVMDEPLKEMVQALEVKS